MTPLQRAAQQALSTLESGVLLCELTAASILRVALEAEQAQAVEPVTWKAHIQTARNVYSDFLDVQEALNYLEQVFLAAIPAPPPAQQVAVPMTEDQIEDVRIELCDSHTISRPAMAAIVRAIEAHHGITANPYHTDWSAA